MGSSDGSTRKAISFTAEGISSASAKLMRYGDTPVQGINSNVKIINTIKVAKLALLSILYLECKLKK